MLEFEDAFALEESELGCTPDIVHMIDTADQQPFREPPRHVPVVTLEVS